MKGNNERAIIFVCVLLKEEEEEEEEEFICQHVGWRQSKVIIADAGKKVMSYILF
jgi:hypothetical protein